MPHFAFHSSVCCGLHSIFLSQTQHGPTSFIWSHSCQISNAIFLAKSHNQYRVLSVFSDVFDIISYAYHLACEVSTSILLFLIISRAFLLIVSSHWLLLNKTHSFFFSSFSSPSMSHLWQTHAKPTTISSQLTHRQRFPSDFSPLLLAEKSHLLNYVFVDAYM